MAVDTQRQLASGEPRVADGIFHSLAAQHSGSSFLRPRYPPHSSVIKTNNEHLLSVLSPDDTMSPTVATDRQQTVTTSPADA